jgi:hypothetical protein
MLVFLCVQTPDCLIGAATVAANALALVENSERCGERRT